MKRAMSGPDGGTTKHALADLYSFISRGGPLQEFYLLPYDNGESCDVALLPHNSRKNRYTNVVSTDSKRVVLSRGGTSDSEDAVPEEGSAAIDGETQTSRFHVAEYGEFNDEYEELEDASYMNASWLPGVDAGTHKMTDHAFISTQAPLPTTIDDFLFMAWQQRAAAVIMIGSYTERGIPKIDRYVPSCVDQKCRRVTTMEKEDNMDTSSKQSDSTESKTDEVFPEEVPFNQVMFEGGTGVISDDGVLTTRTMNVKCTSETFYSDVGVLERCLSVWPTEGGEKEARTVRHFHLCNWPDHDVPDATKPLRMFIKRLYTVQQQAAAADPVPHPLIVHCSAGIGRTGVFCVSHQLMYLFIGGNKDNKVTASTEVSIYDIVERFRSCRPGMVQTDQQYRFCYQVVADEARDLGIISAPSPVQKTKTREVGVQGERSPKWSSDCSIL